MGTFEKNRKQKLISSDPNHYKNQQNESQSYCPNSQASEDVDLEALEGGDRVTLGLPSDIFLEIFSRLSIGHLARCRCVCKTWRKIVQHPRFTSMHHNKAVQHHNNSSACLVILESFGEDGSEIHLLEYDVWENHKNLMTVNPLFSPANLEFEMVYSCHGLLCLSDNLYYDPIYVCNPVIGEYVELPEISKSTDYDIVSGFGYDEVKNEYKVLRMRFDFIGSETFELKAEVYTLGSGMWQKLGNVPYPLRSKSSQVFVRGALHWMTDDHVNLPVSELIISFDIAKENFGVVPPPPGFSYNNNAYRYHLGDLRQSLCFFDYSHRDRVETWLMNDYGVKDSWVKQHVISWRELGYDRDFGPKEVFDDGEILLVYNGKSLICYDTKRRTVGDLGTCKLPSGFLTPQSFILGASFPSKISLDQVLGVAAIMGAGIEQCTLFLSTIQNLI